MDDVKIDGITAADRMELEGKLEGVQFSQSADHDHGSGDMGIFTIIVPLAIALAPSVRDVLKEWLRQRNPETEVEVRVDKDGTTRKIKTKGGKNDRHFDEILGWAAGTGE